MSFHAKLVGVVIVAVALFCVVAAVAQEKAPAPALLPITGTVKASGADSKLGCPATVESRKRVGEKWEKVIYNVVNDDNGKKLAKEADGKRVEIKGTVETKDKVEWLTVKEFTVVVPKAAK